MSFSKYLILLLSASLFLSSCQDSKTKKTNSTNHNSSVKKAVNKKKHDSLLKSVKIPAGGRKTSVDIASIKTVEQEQLIPYLKKYGEENPETEVLIKTSFGKIRVHLYKDTPLHRANFIRLVKMGYFNTSFFHRVAKGFVIQGGNSDRMATTKIRNKVGDFLIPNEAKPDHLHNRGAFSAAKYTEQNVSNASSPFEFFIVQSKTGAHHLDNKHTVFGKVLSGMDVVDKIAQVKVDEREWPKENIEMEIEIID